MSSQRINPTQPYYNTTQVYNVNTSHPLIPNSQEYIYYNKFVSIHSEDRDLLKYPNSNEFEIELPEDFLNVSTIRLLQWTFPANYNVFSEVNNNTSFSFKINSPYNPGSNMVSDFYNQRIFEALWYNKDSKYTFLIEEGFYNPQQMVIELTNKLNYTVTQYIISYFNQQISLHPGDGWEITLEEFNLNGGYNRFIVVYNNVSLKVWFGNRADGFSILSELGSGLNVTTGTICSNLRSQLPDASNYGLYSNIGLSRCNANSISSNDVTTSISTGNINGVAVPRFYYGDVIPGDNGYWLLPLDLSGCQAHWIECPYKLNCMGEAYIYMELAGQNCIDETAPYSISNFTLTTNQTNGIVNSSFAKIPVPSTPLSQWFDRDSTPYKYYYPPAERIRRLKFRLRYHNGQLVNFGVFNYSFMLQFTLQVPQILRNSAIENLLR